MERLAIHYLGALAPIILKLLTTLVYQVRPKSKKKNASGTTYKSISLYLLFHFPLLPSPGGMPPSPPLSPSHFALHEFAFQLLNNIKEPTVRKATSQNPTYTLQGDGRNEFSNFSCHQMTLSFAFCCFSSADPFLLMSSISELSVLLLSRQILHPSSSC